MCQYLLVQMFINDDTILHGHGHEPHYFATVSIYSTNVCAPKHNQLFVLVYVELFSKVVGPVRNRVCSLEGGGLAQAMMTGINSLKSSAYAPLRSMDTLRC